MDSHRFDALAKQFSVLSSRRTGLRLLLAGLVAGPLGPASAGDPAGIAELGEVLEAEARGSRRRRKKGGKGKKGEKGKKKKPCREITETCTDAVECCGSGGRGCIEHVKPQCAEALPGFRCCKTRFESGCRGDCDCCGRDICEDGVCKESCLSGETRCPPGDFPPCCPPGTTCERRFSCRIDEPFTCPAGVDSCDSGPEVRCGDGEDLTCKCILDRAGNTFCADVDCNTSCNSDAECDSESRCVDCPTLCPGSVRGRCAEPCTPDCMECPSGHFEPCCPRGTTCTQGGCVTDTPFVCPAGTDATGRPLIFCGPGCACILDPAGDPYCGFSCSCTLECTSDADCEVPPGFTEARCMPCGACRHDRPVCVKRCPEPAG